MTAHHPASFADFFFMDPALVADPYPIYSRLLAQGPIGFDPDINTWVVVGHAEVSAGLRDPRLSAQRMPDGDDLPPEWAPAQPILALVSRQMLFRDPPDHTRLRSLVSKAFTPRMIEQMRADIMGIVDGLLNTAQAKGGMDAIADFAYPLPTTVIARMLGIPEADNDRFKRWSDDFATFLGTPQMDVIPRLGQSIAELTAYFQALIPTRRGDEQDLLAALLHAEEHGERLSETEVLANIILLLAAGHETTTNLIGNGLYALLTHPKQMQRLRDDPALIPTAVEEFLRFDPPVQYTTRIVTQDLTIANERVPAGREIFFALAAANRDPAQFADPDALDVGRRDNRHVSFAFGPHFCLGAPLARLEGQIAFAELLRRLPAMRLLEDAPPHMANAAFHGFSRLPITF
jgi:cytochrome P450